VAATLAGFAVAGLGCDLAKPLFTPYPTDAATPLLSNNPGDPARVVTQVVASEVGKMREVGHSGRLEGPPYDIEKDVLDYANLLNQHPDKAPELVGPALAALADEARGYFFLHEFASDRSVYNPIDLDFLTAIRDNSSNMSERTVAQVVLDNSPNWNSKQREEAASGAETVIASHRLEEEGCWAGDVGQLPVGQALAYAALSSARFFVYPEQSDEVRPILAAYIARIASVSSAATDREVASKALQDGSEGALAAAANSILGDTPVWWHGPTHCDQQTAHPRRDPKL
jgi:hypothetical protein